MSILALEPLLLDGAAWLVCFLLPSPAVHRPQLQSEMEKPSQRHLIHIVNFPSAPGLGTGVGVGHTIASIVTGPKEATIEYQGSDSQGPPT